MLSLQYSGDQFLNKVNSEMFRKQKIKPPSTISQKQRCRMATVLSHTLQPDPLLMAITSPLQARKASSGIQIAAPEKIPEDSIGSSASSSFLPGTFYDALFTNNNKFF